MGIPPSVSIDEIRIRGSIKDSDVLRLRRAFQDDSAVTLEAAEALLSLDEACRIKDPAWAEFFIEALTDYIVHQAKPEGYVVADKARWLIARLGQDGRIRGRVQLDLLINVINAARWSPASLVTFALDQVRFAIQTASGPLRMGNSLEPGAISSADIELVRRVLLAFGGEGGFATTRAEAEALLAIDAAIAPGKSTPAWTDFVVKAVGNGVLSALGRVVPSRGDVLRSDDVEVRALSGRSRPDWPADRGQWIGGSYAGSMIAGGSGSIWASCRPQSAEERAMGRLERQRLEIVTNEVIEEANEAWLLSRFERGRHFSDNEIALLAFLKHEAGTLPPSLNELVARAQIAA